MWWNLSCLVTLVDGEMDFWPEFDARSWGREFLAGGFGGTAGVIAGYPLDTVRIMQQNSKCGSSAFTILRNVLAKQGGAWARPWHRSHFSFIAECCGFPVVRDFLSRFRSIHPSYKDVALGGTGAGALQSLILSPVELVKIQLQLQTNTQKGPGEVAKNIMKAEGLRGLFRGLGVTILRDAPSYGVYFWTYEYTREQLHRGCRKSGKESLWTMLVAGGLAGVASWISCYPLDVVKTRLQAQSLYHPEKYNGILDCFRKSVRSDGYVGLWRGVGTTVSRAFLVNGVTFSAYEIALKCLFSNGSIPQ